MSNGLYSLNSAVPIGVSAQPVRVDVHVSAGLPSFTVVGVPDAPCREIRDRVRAAVINAGWRWPTRRITISVTPTGTARVSSALDLPVAIGLLAATGQLHPDPDETIAAFGELALDGSIRPVPGHVAILQQLDADRVFEPPMQLTPMAFPVDAAAAVEVRHLRDLPDALTAKVPEPRAGSLTRGMGKPEDGRTGPRGDQLRGLTDLEAALAVAVGGGHHTLVVGSAGAGKTGLVRQLPRLLPELDDEEWLDQLVIRSATPPGDPDYNLLNSRRRPVRVVGPDYSSVRLFGGATGAMRPGECSLAHHGLLVLDDLHLDSRQTLQPLLVAMDEGSITVARGSRSTILPAQFQLVATSTHCGCGAPTPSDCSCSEIGRARFLSKITRSVQDRFDIVIDLDHLHRQGVEARVRDFVVDRVLTTEISDEALPTLAPLSPEAQVLLDGEVTAGRFSARGRLRAWRLAWTIHRLRGHSGDIGDLVTHEAIRLRLGNLFGDDAIFGGHGPQSRSLR